MLEKRVERILVIFILFLCFFVVGFFGTKYKLLNLPINKGLSPEKIIEAEFNNSKFDEYDKNYKYIIRDEFLFAGIQSENGYWQLEVATKNDNSGYIFKVPGIVVGQTLVFDNRLLPDFSIGDDENISVGILNFKNSYVVVVDKWDDEAELQVFANGVKVESLTGDAAKNDFWIYVIEDLSKETQINCIFKDEEYHIVNNEEIRALYQGVE